ncbi:hypothetical protein LINPERHAP2_LOCUS1955, partial [Linum perenne]
MYLMKNVFYSRWPSFGSFDVFSSCFDEISGFQIVGDLTTSSAL